MIGPFLTIGVPQRPTPKCDAGRTHATVHHTRRGPALGEQDLIIPDDKCQIASFTQLSSRAVRLLRAAEVHGWMELAKRHPTIYFRAENLNVAEQEVGNKEPFCRSRCDSAAEHDYSRCASARCLPRSPALSVLDVPASQASS